MNGPGKHAAYLNFGSGPSVEAIAKALPDLGDCTASMLAELARDPTPERCDRMLSQLDGARQLVAMLRGKLREGATGGER